MTHQIEPDAQVAQAIREFLEVSDKGVTFILKALPRDFWDSVSETTPTFLPHHCPELPSEEVEDAPKSLCK